MARVTVEDCLANVENRFSLVHLAAQRTRQIHQGSIPTVQCTNRQIVTSLREIAEGNVQGIRVEDQDETSEEKSSI